MVREVCAPAPQVGLSAVTCTTLQPDVGAELSRDLVFTALSGDGFAQLIAEMK